MKAKLKCTFGGSMKPGITESKKKSFFDQKDIGPQRASKPKRFFWGKRGLVKRERNLLECLRGQII